MSSSIRSVVGAVVAFSSVSLFAVTPVAVWEGDFSQSCEGYTINLNGNTVIDGAVTIGEQGILVKWTGDANPFGAAQDDTKIQVLVKYSDFPIPATADRGAVMVSLTGSQNGNTDYLGSCVIADGAVRGIWNNGTIYDSHNKGDRVNITSTDSIGKFITSYTRSTTSVPGTSYTYEGITAFVGDQLGYGATGLKAAYTVGDISIGGKVGDSANFVTATGMKVYGIAIFNSLSSPAELNAYVWPSETPEVEVSGVKSWSELNVTATNAIALKVTGDATLTIDESVNLSSLSIVSEGASLSLSVAEGVTASIDAYDCSKAQGQVTLNITQGTSRVVAGTDTVLVGLGTGEISIAAGKKLTISESGLRKTQLTNNGTLNITGGNAEYPIEIYDNGAAATGMGDITLAANAYVRHNATSGNKIYKITGAEDGSSTLVLSSGQNWGMTDGTAIRHVKLLVRDKNFWWERASALDKTVDLDYGSIELNLGNPDGTFEIGSLTGSGVIRRNVGTAAVTINADRIGGVLSGTPSAAITVTVKGTCEQEITSVVGPLVIGGGVLKVGSQTIASLQNDGTLMYAYSDMPTIERYTGTGNFVVDMTGTTLVAGTQYQVVDIVGVSREKVSLTGIDLEGDFQLYNVVDGVILADSEPAVPAWVGDSGEWTASVFDGMALETDGAAVGFADATSGVESVTVTLVGRKSVASANFSANTTAYELTGDQLAGAVSLLGAAPVTLKTAPALTDGGLTGTGPLVLDLGPDSTFEMSKNNTGYDGEAVIASGTVKMGNAYSFGPFGRDSAIRVKSGATLDANGASNAANEGHNNKLILEQGATFSNSRGLGDVKFFAFYDLTVEGDATIDASTANNGLTRHFNKETYVHLGTNTLTKTGANTFYISGTRIDGSGTIYIAEGTLDLPQAFNSTQPSFPDGTIKIGSGARLNLNGYGQSTKLTVKNLVVVGSGAVTSGNPSETSVTVTGALTIEGGSSGSEMAVPDQVRFSTDTTITAIGDGMLNLGTSRPTNQITLGENTGLKVQMKTSADSVIQLNLAAMPSSVVVLSAEGDPMSAGDYSMTMEDGTLTIRTVAVLPAHEGTVFDVAANWSSLEVPASGQNVVIELTEDTEVTVNGNFTLGTLSISGAGRLTLTGEGSLSATTVYLVDGASFAHDAAKLVVSTGYDVAAGSKLILDAGEGSLTVSLPITGAGAVETKGDVTLDAENSFTGGLTVKSGTLSTTRGQGFGGTDFNYGARITVEDGACVDLNNTKDWCYKYTIAGKGIATTVDGVTTYSGVLKNTGPQMSDGSRQTKSITLSDDALITVNAGSDWGIIGSGLSETDLFLNGHTLTKCGAGSFWVCHTRMHYNGGGTVVVEDGTMRIFGNPGNQTGVNWKIVKSGALQLDATVSGLASLKFSAGNAGVSFTGIEHLDDAIHPTLDAAYVDASALTVGETLTLLSDPAGGITEGLFSSINAGSRFADVSVTSTAVTATVRPPAKFLHYDFEGNEATVTGAKAEDSLYEINPWGDKNGDGPFVGFGGKTGRAAHIFYKSNGDRFVPYWNGNSANLSPLHAGSMTVTTVAKLKFAGDPDRATMAVPVWGLGATTGTNKGIGLIAVDADTVAVVRWSGGSSEVLVSKSGIKDLTTAYHFFAVVATPNSTTLYVDRTATTSDKAAYPEVGQQGQLGSLHGGIVADYPRVNENDDGYYLDDWAVYDSALSKTEISELRRELCPDPFVIRMR